MYPGRQRSIWGPEAGEFAQENSWGILFLLFIYSCHLDEAALLSKARSQVAQVRLIEHKILGGAPSWVGGSVELVPKSDHHLRF